MCEYRAASYRLGMVVSAKDKGDVNTINSVAAASLVGQSIVGNVSFYVKASVAAIHACADADPDQAFLRGAHDIEAPKSLDVRSRFAPGLILDLPSIGFQSAMGTISIRSCITVCSNGSRSKVWTRFVTKNDELEITYTEDQLLQFRLAAEAVCRAVNESIRVQYQQEFQHVTDFTDNLEVFGNIHLFTVECVGNGITNELREIATDLLWADEKLTSVVEQEVANALRDVTDVSSIPQEGKDQCPDSPDFQLSAEANFFTYEASTGAPNLLVNHTAGHDSFFVGLIGVGGATAPATENDDPPDPEHRDFPVGVGTTAEIAGFIGSGF